MQKSITNIKYFYHMIRKMFKCKKYRFLKIVSSIRITMLKAKHNHDLISEFIQK